MTGDILLPRPLPRPPDGSEVSRSLLCLPPRPPREEKDENVGSSPACAIPFGASPRPAPLPRFLTSPTSSKGNSWPSGPTDIWPVPGRESSFPRAFIDFLGVFFGVRVISVPSKPSTSSPSTTDPGTTVLGFRFSFRFFSVWGAGREGVEGFEGAEGLLGSEGNKGCGRELERRLPFSSSDRKSGSRKSLGRVVDWRLRCSY
mmetsp:Transcript_36951/g.59787  ORF Transcript_36951/g.59787 Transcript_36951/m.59787 type:complete len:202 (-) Transcript_36951:4744-5349(-)